jgi:virginiamycin B lyase
LTQGLNGGARPVGITAGPDGNLWFTDQNNAIGRVTPAGAITEFSQGLSAGGIPEAIVAGPDGNLWFTLASASRSGGSAAIGRINPMTGMITEFSQGLNFASSPIGITGGPDGSIWFTDEGCDSSPPTACAIGRIDPMTGVIAEFPVGFSAGSFPESIASGPGGNLWFTTQGGSTPAIGRITPAGVITEFSQGLGPETLQFAISAGPDGNLWFAENASSALGQITPAGSITHFSRGLNPSSLPVAITAGPDGNLWFADVSAIGRLSPPPSSSTLVAAILPTSRSVQVGGATATVFATIINAGPNAASNCGIVPLTVVPARFFYQTTDPGTNLPTGSPGVPADIAPGRGADLRHGFCAERGLRPDQYRVRVRLLRHDGRSLPTGRQHPPALGIDDTHARHHRIVGNHYP